MQNRIISDVFFDLDHTLWDFEKNSGLTFQTILNKNNVGVNIADFMVVYSRINYEYWELYRVDKITQEELRYGRLKDTFEELDYEISDALIHLLSEEYIAHLPEFNYLYEGAIEVLEYLKPKYRLHIITNGFHKVQDLKLKNSAIAHYFDTVTDSESAGVKKPNPIIFKHALHVANTQVENSIMIGDCIVSDINASLSLGFDAIYFNEHNKDVAVGIKHINNLLSLKTIL